MNHLNNKLLEAYLTKINKKFHNILLQKNIF